MPLRYDLINVKIIDDLREICERPTTKWTDEEVTKVWMILEAIRIAINQRTKG